jgi:hypothetical protein
VTFNFSGALLDLKGFPGHRRPSFSVDAATPRTVFQRLHLTYFLGYAVWNYLTTPFFFARMGFATRELDAHVEGRETWRILEVAYPDDVPAHTKVQKLYVDDDFMLRRIDYVTDVLGGVAAHYCYDQATIDGLVFPTVRRVVRRTPEGPLLSGRTSFILDYTELVTRE